MVDMRKAPIGRDAGGYEAITQAVKVMLNQFPGLNPDDEVKFEELTESGSIAFVNDTGALVYTEKKSIIGIVHQECRYPFLLVYRFQSSQERDRKSVV